MPVNVIVVSSQAGVEVTAHSDHGPARAAPGRRSPALLLSASSSPLSPAPPLFAIAQEGGVGLRHSSFQLPLEIWAGRAPASLPAKCTGCLAPAVPSCRGSKPNGDSPDRTFITCKASLLATTLLPSYLWPTDAFSGAKCSAFGPNHTKRVGGSSTEQGSVPVNPNARLAGAPGGPPCPAAYTTSHSSPTRLE